MTILPDFLHKESDIFKLILSQIKQYFELKMLTDF